MATQVDVSLSDVRNSLGLDEILSDRFSAWADKYFNRETSFERDTLFYPLHTDARKNIDRTKHDKYFCPDLYLYFAHHEKVTAGLIRGTARHIETLKREFNSKHKKISATDKEKEQFNEELREIEANLLKAVNELRPDNANKFFIGNFEDLVHRIKNHTNLLRKAGMPPMRQIDRTTFHAHLQTWQENNRIQEQKKDQYLSGVHFAPLPKLSQKEQNNNSKNDDDEKLSSSIKHFSYRTEHIHFDNYKMRWMEVALAKLGRPTAILTVIGWSLLVLCGVFGMVPLPVVVITFVCSLIANFVVYDFDLRRRFASLGGGDRDGFYGYSPLSTARRIAKLFVKIMLPGGIFFNAVASGAVAYFSMRLAAPVILAMTGVTLAPVFWVPFSAIVGIVALIASFSLVSRFGENYQPVIETGLVGLWKSLKNFFKGIFGIRSEEQVELRDTGPRSDASHDISDLPPSSASITPGRDNLSREGMGHSRRHNLAASKKGKKGKKDKKDKKDKKENKNNTTKVAADGGHRRRHHKPANAAQP